MRVTEQTPDTGPEDPARAIVDASHASSDPTGPVFVLTVLIGAFALFTLFFNATCQSDGCIGVFVPLAITWILVAIQILVALPIYAFQCSKRDVQMSRRSAVLIIGSLAAALIAGIFAL